MYRMTGAGRWRRILNTGRVREQVCGVGTQLLMIIWSVYLYVFCRLRTAIFVPRGKRSDWIFISVFFFVNLSQTEVLRGAHA